MCNQRINIMIQRHVSSAKLIDRVGKGRNDRVPRDFSPRRVRACDREFANGTRLSTPPSFPPRSRSEGAIVAGKSRRRSSSLSLPLVFLGVCIACGKMTMHRWPRARYALRGYALAAPGNSPMHERTCNSRTILSTPLLFTSRV